MLRPTQKKWRLFRTWAAGHPIWCGWQVTYRCNYRCRFCHYWNDPLGRVPEPTIEQYAAGAAKLAQLGTVLVSLAGGEPMLRTDLPDIVRAIGKYHFPLVTTNGWFVTPQSADALMSAGVWGVSVSIDYARPELHDKRRGMVGAWKQAWRAVEMLVKARKHRFQRVNVMSVLLDDNIDELNTVVKMAADRGAHFMVQPYGFRKTGSHAYAHNNGAVAPKLLKLKERWPNFLSNPNYLSRFDEFLAGGINHCRAGRAFFNIDSAGDIAICVEHKNAPVANIYRNNAQTIVSRLSDAASGNRCTDCWYNCRGEVENLYDLKGLVKSVPTLFKTGAAIKADKK
ncbi:MAG: radical SAM protein [Phycisphaerae bacterium]|jgi:MoaA/NifB/PqqE/SkfB family radical SAM enzyme|nr:radical SAM protein [Phycisphaerae bacterium]